MADRTVVLDATGTAWRATVYTTRIDDRQFFALTKGSPGPYEPVLCRMHAGSTIGDVFASTAREGGRQLRQAIARIEAAGVGVIVYLPPRGDLAGELESLTGIGRDPHEMPKDGPQDNPLREFGLGAQVLTDLGVQKLRLLTDNPRKIAGLAGYGLEVVESVPLVAESK